MPIDISGLPKAKVMAALIENVFGRSEAALYRYKNAKEKTANKIFEPFSEIFEGRPRKDNGPPSEADLAIHLNKKHEKILKIGRRTDLTPEESHQYEVSKKYEYNFLSIGTVYLDIDFSTDLIDTSAYDGWHATSTTEGVKTASELINLLREEQSIYVRDFHNPKITNIYKEAYLTRVELKDCIETDNGQLLCPAPAPRLSRERLISKKPDIKKNWSDISKNETIFYTKRKAQFKLS